jgi:hypothetical protein
MNQGSRGFAAPSPDTKRRRVRRAAAFLLNMLSASFRTSQPAPLFDRKTRMRHPSLMSNGIPSNSLKTIRVATLDPSLDSGVQEAILGVPECRSMGTFRISFRRSRFQNARFGKAGLKCL